MEARYKGICLAALALCSLAAMDRPRGYTERSRNFVVTAPTHEIAKQIAQQAEIYRHKLAVEWLGKPLPAWKAPCTVHVNVGQIGAGGATTFVFLGNSVSDYKMNIQGPLDRILDSVLPHEVNHTIFAEHFRRPLPRWADEGAATFVEDESERKRQMLLAMQVLKTSRRIPLRSLLAIMDYPRDMQDVLHLYAEGYVLVELLIQNGGRAKFLNFLKAAHIDGWDRSLHTFYGHRGIDAFEKNWNQWVLAGCPAKVAPEGTMLASTEPPANVQDPKVLARSQAPDREPVTAEAEANAFDDVASTIPSVPKRGMGLQAPPPSKRTEPAMLSKVELGSGTTFNASRPRQATSRSAEENTRPARQPRYVAEADVEPQVEEDVEPERIVRPSRPTRPSSTKNTASRTVAGSRTPMTPLLRLDTRPQYGQAQPFPEEETDFVGDVAG